MCASFMLTKEIDDQVLPFYLPPYSIPANATGDGQLHKEIGNSGILSELGSTIIIIIPIFAISISIAKAFCKKQSGDL